MDPSQDLDEADFSKATAARAGVYQSGTIFWKSSNAYYMKAGEQDWTPMRGTGQIVVPGGWFVYVSGGEIRRSA